MASSSSAPWNLEEIHKNASSWSLEGDAQLLKFMQAISSDLDKRASETTTKLYRLSLDLDRSTVCLGNITNKLSALQHTQFVENRVYEDDETIANVSEVPSGDQEEKKKYDPMETLTKVLNSSMKVLGNCYERASIAIDDSDDEGGEEAAKSVIYRPKNPYDNRSLPYKIGSKEWLEKWHMGIGDSDEDYSGDEKADEEFSESSENESISASLPSNGPTISESELSAWELHRNSATNIRETIESYESSDDEILQKTSKVGQDILPQYPPASQYYVHQPKQRDRGLFDESTDESTDSELYNIHPEQQKKQTTGPVATTAGGQKISNILSSEPPPDMDVVDRRQKPSVNLFEDSEEEKDDYNREQPAVAALPVPVKKTEQPGNNTRKKTVNLFDDDDFDSFMKELNTKTQLKSNTSQEKVRNLFYESSEEEEEAKAEIPTSNQKLLKPDPEETSPSASTTKNISIVTKKNLFETESPLSSSPEKENISATNLKQPKPAPRVNLTNNQQNNDFLDIAKPKRSLMRSLFDDDPPDDDFDTLFKPKSQNSSQSVLSAKNPTLDHSDEENEQHKFTTDFPGKQETKADTIEKLSHTDAVPPKSMKEDLKSTNLFAFESSEEEDSSIFDSKDKLAVRSQGDPLKSQPGSIIIEQQKTDEIKTAKIEESLPKLPASNTPFSNLFVKDDFDDDSSDLFNSGKQTVEERIVTLKSEDSGDLIVSNYSENIDIKDEVDNLGLAASDVISKTNFTTAFEEISSKSALPKTNLPAKENIFSSALFSDTPPDDEGDIYVENIDDSEILDQASIEKENNSFNDDVPSQPTGLLTEPISSSNVLNYNNISIFHDTPPDDDFEATSHDRKKLHNIFYDDFSETIVPSQIDTTTTKSLSAYIFNEPPPDSFQSTPISSGVTAKQEIESDILKDELDKSESNTDANKMNFSKQMESSKTDKSISQNKVKSLIGKMKTSNTETVADSSAKNKPQPRRLNSNVNINVAALLPGSKRPQAKPSTSENSQAILKTRSESFIGDNIVESTPRSVQIESDPSRLQSLNRTRAKIQIKRKPSTRKGRQENYRKSLIEAEDEAISTTTPKGEIATDESSKLFGQKLEFDVSSHDKSAQNQVKFKEHQAELDSSTISRNESELSIDKTSNRSIYDALFGDHTLADETKKHEAYHPNSFDKVPSTKSTLFFNDMPPEDNFASSSLPVKTTKQQSHKSFLDPESSDNDELFGANATENVLIQSETKAEKRMPSESSTRQEPEAPKHINVKNSVLYDDFSDNDKEDDLFAKTLKANTKQPKLSGKKFGSKSIFESDDDDDDIFGGSSEVTKSNLEVAKTEPIVSRLGTQKSESSNQASSKSLFDDSDNDEDLFGGVVENKEKAILSTKRKSDKKRPVVGEAVHSSTDNIFNDPLADLLRE